ncbi:MAG TPA: HEAT repeat domain-containing protein [Bryobacteraceae bacterium]|jgi:HEAT repeat protein|nr:HEAT repeat domain-containing protein [Bryobacteraceae bacterium]
MVFPRPWCVCLLTPLLVAGALPAGNPHSTQDETGYSTKERINHIRQLGKSNPAAIPELAGYVSSPDRDIRIEAVKAIVRLDTERSLTPLLKATSDSDPEIQIRATDGIVNFYDPGYVVKNGLTSSFTKGFRQIKGFFAKRNDEVIDPGITVRPDVAIALGNLAVSASDSQVRANAALAAGVLRARQAVPGLIEALQSRKSDIIFECLVAFQKIGDQSAGPRVAFLANDFDERVQTTALETLGVLGARDSAPVVRRALNGAKNVRVRRAALGALAMMALPADRPIFQQYLNDKDAQVRVAALEGLGGIREPEDYPAIEAAYNEPNADPAVHLAAAYALVNEGKLDTSEFSPLLYLVQTLDSKARHDDARRYLIQACRRADVRKAVLPLLASATRDEKIGLGWALAESHDPDVIPSLQSLSNDSDPTVSLAAAKALKIVMASRP